VGPHQLVPHPAAQDALWTIEYADQGEGLPLLVSHGVLGCHVDTVDTGWANLPGSGFRVIGPSRFGYFGSTLPDGATPADQADAYALLLDHLGVDRAVVIGYSAGSGSVLEFALAHRQRVIGLILACCRLGGGVTVGKAFAPLFRLAYNDRLFWVFKKLMPTAYSRMMGIPKGYRPSPPEAAAIAASRDLLFPLKPRRDGAVFDGFVANLVADRFPLEQLTVPTLVISARDDPLAPYRFAAKAASRIPGAKLVTIEAGGHLFMGHDAEVRKEIGAFVQGVT
jgi:pimeloyl-ACP methyl ester carboxylesterase